MESTLDYSKTRNGLRGLDMGIEESTREKVCCGATLKRMLRLMCGVTNLGRMRN